MGREISKKDMDLHQLYHFGQKKHISNTNLQAEKEWLEFLSRRNKEVKKYPRNDFDAFLWSRWVVCCMATRKILSIFVIRLAWYKPEEWIKM